jgi:hypothetical protein
MPLQATSGAASYDAFGGGVPFEPVYIESIFQTWLYTGNGSTQTINNGIDLAGKGGLVWVKCRGAAFNNALVDTVRGANQTLFSNSDAGNQNYSGSGTINTFSATGFNVGTNALTNATAGAGGTFASWTFRKQPKFFDVVTYTGNGINGTAIPHNLGSVPGCIIIKRTNSTGSWFVYHRSYNGGVNPHQYNLYLNTTDALMGPGTWSQFQTPTSEAFYPTGGANSLGGATYVAYLFAHNAGGFGLTGTDNVISCGSYTGNGSTTGPVIDLGYEPQLVMVKRTNGISPWTITDSMRGFTVQGVEDAQLWANWSNAEDRNYESVSPTATGFVPSTASDDINASGGTYIYIAIRRGPMRTPTSGTSVYNAIARSGTSATTTVNGVGFSPDAVLPRRRSAGATLWFDRLRGVDTSGSRYLVTSSTGSESYFSNLLDLLLMDGVQLGSGSDVNASGTNYINYFFKRAPSFFDVVCYTGTGANLAVNHNLGVAPEMMIVKRRDSSTGSSWSTAHIGRGSPWATFNGLLYDTGAFDQYFAWYQNPTSTQFFVEATGGQSASGGTYVAYLFASCPGVSKVGSYTGTGANLTVDCGFTGGARFVLVKRTDSTGNWWVFDTARGMTTGTDPRLALNSTAAELNANWINTVATGFQIVTTDASVNASGGSYIYLAIA